MKVKTLFSSVLVIAFAFPSLVYSAENRGRIQVQGAQPRVEKSSSWDQAKPITAENGLSRLNTVWNSLSAAEQKDRRQAYECAKKFIQNAKASGGVSAPVSKTCQDSARKDKTARIDIEVIAGSAFK